MLQRTFGSGQPDTSHKSLSREWPLRDICRSTLSGGSQPLHDHYRDLNPDEITQEYSIGTSAMNALIGAEKYILGRSS